MRILIITMILSSFSAIFAESLPTDFHFKPASSKRTSFVSQFKEYEEEQEHKGQLLLTEPALVQDFHNCDEIKDVQYGWFEKCRQLIIQTLAYFWMKQN